MLSCEKNLFVLRGISLKGGTTHLVKHGHRRNRLARHHSDRKNQSSCGFFVPRGIRLARHHCMSTHLENPEKRDIITQNWLDHMQLLLLFINKVLLQVYHNHIPYNSSPTQKKVIVFSCAFSETFPSYLQKRLWCFHYWKLGRICSVSYTHLTLPTKA